MMSTLVPSFWCARMKLPLLPRYLRRFPWPRLFGDGTDRRADRRRAGHQRASSLVESLDFSSLTLDEILRLEPGILATKLHVITLRRFKETIGTEWARLADRVDLIFAGIVRRFLGPKTVCGRHGDDTFILSFSGQSEAEGRRQAVVIANELMHRLIGERFVGAQICVAEIGIDDIRGSDGALDEAALSSVLAEAVPVARPGDRAAPPEAAAGPASLNGAAGQDERAAAADAPHWVPLLWPPEGGGRGGWGGHGAADAAAAVPPGVGIVFRPTWGARWQAIDAYLCLPRRQLGDRTLTGGAVLPPQALPAQAATLDFALLHGALTRLIQAIDKRRGVPLIVPLRFASLQAPYWTTVAAILRAFSDAARLRYLLLEVTEVPAAANADHMIGLGAMVRPLCRDLLVRTTLSEPRIEVLRHCQPAAIGCDIAAHDPAAGNVKTLLDRFAAAAGSQRIYVWGLKSRPMAAAAVALRATYLNGAAIMADVPEPAGAMAMPAEALARLRPNPAGPALDNSGTGVVTSGRSPGSAC